MIEKYRITPLLFLLIGGCFVSSAFAHDYHSSLTEIEYNPNRGFLEVAVRVIPEDLETQLAHLHGKLRPIDSEAMDGDLIDYFQHHFVVRRGNDPLPLSWVGKEISHRAAWLYFELEVHPEPGGELPPLTLYNRLLFDLEPSQRNHVLFRSGETQASWVFTTESRPVVLPLLPKN